MRSCSALGGWGRRAASRCCQFRRKQNGYSADYDNFVVRDVGQLTAVSPIAWKRRVNQQEIHQPSIKSLSAYNPMLSQHFVYMHAHVCISLAFSMGANCTRDKEILYVGRSLCKISGSHPEEGSSPSSEEMNLMGHKINNMSENENK